MHKLFEWLTSAMRPESKNQSLLHSEVVTLLRQANLSGLALRRQGLEGYKFVGPNSDEWESKIKNLALLNGQHFQEMEVDMQQCIAESGIEVIESR